MNKTLSIVAAAAFALLGTQAVLAQDKTRAEVKQEAAAANKAGDIATGQQAPMKVETPKEAAKHSDTTRAARKEKTAAANKAGQIDSNATESKAAAKEQTSTKTDTTRAARKAKTAAENKAGEIPAGTADIAPKNK